jgi:hypothetical protein
MKDVGPGAQRLIEAWNSNALATRAEQRNLAMRQPVRGLAQTYQVPLHRSDAPLSVRVAVRSASIHSRNRLIGLSRCLSLFNHVRDKLGRLRQMKMHRFARCRRLPRRNCPVNGDMPLQN